MSVYVSGCVWKHSRAKGGSLVTLLALAEIAGHDGVCLPQWDTSLARLGRMTRLSVRAVRYCIVQLIKLGELVAEERPGQSNVYQIVLDKNLNLFEGPPAPEPDPSPEARERQAKRLKALRDRAESVDKSEDAKIAPMQTVAGEGCKTRHEPLQTVAANPSSRLSRPCIPTAGAKGEPTKPVDKSAMPKFIVEWLAAGISPAARTWAAEHGVAEWVELHFEHFRDYVSQPRNWKRYSDLDAAFRTCMRADWGDVRMKAQRESRVRGAAPGGAPDHRPSSCRYCPKPWTLSRDGIVVCNTPACMERAERREPAAVAA